MKAIFEQNPLIFNSFKLMKFSYYTLTVKHFPKPDQYLLYNTRTQALVKVDGEFKTVLDNLNGAGSIPAHYADNVRQLHKMGILVKDAAEDNHKLQGFFQQLKYGLYDSSLVVNIVTTYACNFQCVYCFEQNTRTTSTLDIQTCDLIIGWVQRRMERLGYKEAHLIYYGGEPLLNILAIEYISARLQEWCRANNKQFKFMLQTNGYLLSAPIVQKYLALGLRSVRISLDGVKEEHDRKRPLQGGGPTFERIIQNILACIDEVEIGLSVSYDQQGVEHIARLMDYLDGLNILHKLGRFLFSPIHPGLGPEGKPALLCRQDCAVNYDDDALIKANLRIREIMQAHNLPLQAGMAISACALMREYGGVTIDQEGQIYRCNSMLGHPQFSVGDVRQDEFNSKQKAFRDLDAWQQCPPDCPFLPMCSGGCRLMSFIASGSFNQPSCKRRYLDEMAPEWIKREYEKTSQKSPLPA